jgi:hypothetical protein
MTRVERGMPALPEDASEDEVIVVGRAGARVVTPGGGVAVSSASQGRPPSQPLFSARARPRACGRSLRRRRPAWVESISLPTLLAGSRKWRLHAEGSFV